MSNISNIILRFWIPTKESGFQGLPSNVFFLPVMKIACDESYLIIKDVVIKAKEVSIVKEVMACNVSPVAMF